jgi:molecular chaperone HtpG
MIDLDTKAEELAAHAHQLEAFSGFDLGHAKRQLAELMRHVGENGLFDQYTRHDITHVNAMLRMLDWLIPTSTRERMTTADWLLIVLSIYLHDLGMLVTKAEYAARYESDFPTFRDSRLATKDDEGKDYTERLSKLSGDDRERFLYQEFVRAHHATRIRHWIDDLGKVALGSAGNLADEIADLLANLDPVFRSDLAKICESHHEPDLDDSAKYPIRRHYGNTPAETANVQYAAIILRSADLLQITRDRTPSIAYRVLTPSDPLSQNEWAKQMQVRAVVPQPARDRDGQVDANQESSVIEVHARFTEESGFFGLTSYLSYAAGQLNQSYQWVAESNRRNGSTYAFPWRDVDTSSIETVGFLPSHYEFKLDQRRILDLLTGHTLYNDTNVVVRELAQNAIDAVRLAFYDQPNGGAETHGKVAISWNSDTRILEFRDNGTGMTQEIIENNFLRVGASRYQDPRFREQHPTFNPISRFGIGVLSAFMIADSVEVFTCHPDESEVRQISLRSVHGRYLIRLLDKHKNEMAKSLLPHGTLVRLRVRASAKIDEVEHVARRWFVLPQCRLTVEVNGNPEVQIGHSNLAEALKDAMISSGLLLPESLRNGSVQIRSVHKGAVTVAYAVLWSKWFRTWELLSVNEASWVDSDLRNIYGRQEGQSPPDLGICVEGVRVEFDSPGYEGLHLLAMANASGRTAPRTNVARSGLEGTSELKDLIQDIYGVYCSHISQEIDELHVSRGRSATGASGEATYLLNSLEPYRRSPERVSLRSTEALHDQIRRIKVFLIERQEARIKSSLQDLADLGRLYTIDDTFIDTAESFLRYLPSDASLQQVLNAFSQERDVLPDGPLLVARPSGVLSTLFYSSWQISAVNLNEQALRVTTQWTLQTDQLVWYNDTAADRSISYRDADRVLEQVEFPYSSSSATLHIPLQDLPFLGFENSDYDGVLVGQHVYLNPSAGYIADICGISEFHAFTPAGMALFHYCLKGISLEMPNSRFRDRYEPRTTDSGIDFEAIISSQLSAAMQRAGWVNGNDAELIVRLLPRRPLRIFDPFASRRGFL